MFFTSNICAMTFHLKSLRFSPFLPLLLFLGLSTAFVGFRVLYVRQLTFWFLIWNMFLAVLPVLFALAGEQQVRKTKPLKAVIWFLLCVLFLPNSPYIVTDLFHIRRVFNGPLWYDTLMIFSCATTGLIAFYEALFSIERSLKHVSAHFIARRLAIVTVIFMTGFGIYLGRYLRFNSWDLVSQPLSLLVQITDRFIHPFSHPATWGVTLSYGSLLLIGFICLKWGRPHSKVYRNERQKLT